jgi:hypothetical protein
MGWIRPLLTVIMVCLCVSTAEAGKIDGFRGILWGTEFTSLNSAEFNKIPSFKGITPGMESYKRANEDLQVADTKVESVNYNFYQGKLISVDIDFKWYSAYERLLVYCRERFGPPTATSSRNLEFVYTFQSPKTGALLFFQLGTPQYSDGRLFLFSHELMNRLGGRQ